MGTLISPIVLTRRDVQGNEWVDVYSIYEYRDAGISPGGEAIDLTPYMRRVENIHAQPISGILIYEPRPNATDFPGNAGSGRMELWSLGSGIVTLNISGLQIQILSGNISNLSGLGGLPGGATIASGRIGVTGSGAFNASIQFTQILSGTAVSGARAYIHAFGT